MPAEAEVVSTDPARLSSALSAWLAARHRDAQGISISNVRNPAQGFSNETRLLDLHWTRNGQPQMQPLVLRIESREPGTFPEYDVSVQYHCMENLRDSAVPVPGLFGFEQEAGLLGARFYLMERIDGLVPNENPLYHVEGWMHELTPDGRAALWMEGIDLVAAVADADISGGRFDFLDQRKFGATPLDQMLGYFRNHMLWAESLNRPYPHLHRACDWLYANRPANQPVGLCWGDAKLGNCVYRDGRLVAALDWEGAHLGSPVADLAWWLTIDRCLSQGDGVPRLEGLPDRDKSVARWESASGRRADNLEYYEVFSAFKLASIMARIGTVFGQRGLLPKGFQMDTDNGAANVLAMLGAKHGY
ncbi:MAG: phosphotransferase family protein [Betaproteobacteria bacterium]|nr:phosphotransferase family protein [Betaproteobacteria bacterium]